MIFHWLKTAWRSLIANPLFSLITIASLSIGCCGAILAGSSIVQHLSFERWISGADHIAKVTLYAKAGLVREIPVAVRMMSTGLGGAIDDKRFPEIAAQVLVYDGEFILRGTTAGTEGATPNTPGEEIRAISADPTFFDVFKLPVLYGDAPATLLTPDKVIVTESFAKRLFGTGNAVGKVINIKAWPDDPPQAEIGAVIRDLPPASHFDFEVLAGDGDIREHRTSSAGLPGGFSLQEGRARYSWRALQEGTQYVRFAPGFDFRTGQARLEETFSTMVQTADGAFPEGKTLANVSKVTLVPLVALHLAGEEKTGLPSTGDLLLLITIGGAAVALLSVSAFNYVILSLASSLRRRKEVAIRKVLGAGKGSLVRHYLTEAALIAMISLAIGFAGAELLQPWFARAIAQPDALLNLYDGWFLGVGGLALVALILTVGFYPAFYLASVRPRAGLENSDGDNLGPVGRTVTTGLLAIQVGAATVLLALALTMAAQARYIAERPLGYTLENKYSISNTCITFTQSPNAPIFMNYRAPEQAPCRARRLAELRQIPGIEAVSSFNGTLANSEAIQTEEFGLPGQPDVLGKTARLNVDADFLQMMGAKLLAGRLFDAASPYDRRLIDNWGGAMPPGIERVPVVVTRAMLPLIGAATPADAIGMQIQRRSQGQPPFDIIGVVEDWNQRSLRYQANPLVFVPGALPMAPIVSIQPENADAVIERIKALDPEAATRNAGKLTVAPLADTFSDTYSADQRLMVAVIGFAGVAILVACLGVFGLTAFDMRRRVREIGIRKALGATPRKVAGMVLGRQIAFIAVASIVSWPVGFWLANAWLEQFAYRTALGIAILPIATLGVIAFAALAVGLNTARAASIRPSFALRSAT